MRKVLEMIGNARQKNMYEKRKNIFKKIVSLPERRRRCGAKFSSNLRIQGYADDVRY